VGVIRSEPVVLGSVVYEGVAGGDADDGCVSGGIMALDERTGAPVRPFWQTAVLPGGGGVWSPPEHGWNESLRRDRKRVQRERGRRLRRRDALARPVIAGNELARARVRSERVRRRRRRR